MPQLREGKIDINFDLQFLKLGFRETKSTKTLVMGGLFQQYQKLSSYKSVRFVVSNLGRPDPLEGPLRFDGWMEMVSSLASKKRALGVSGVSWVVVGHEVFRKNGAPLHLKLRVQADGRFVFRCWESLHFQATQSPICWDVA